MVVTESHTLINLFPRPLRGRSKVKKKKQKKPKPTKQTKKPKQKKKPKHQIKIYCGVCLLWFLPERV